MNKIDLVEKLKMRLYKSPFDSVHDLFHHMEVWNNAQMIVCHEGLELDLDLLEICCMSHDLERGSEEHGILVEYMMSLGYSESYIKDALGVINSHSFGAANIVSIESKVLYDADKIEYVNPARLVSMVSAVKNGSMAEDVGVKYGYLLESRIVEVPKSLNYAFSRFLFISKLSVYIEVLPNLKSLYPDLLKGISVESLQATYSLTKSLNG